MWDDHLIFGKLLSLWTRFLPVYIYPPSGGSTKKDKPEKPPVSSASLASSVTESEHLATTDSIQVTAPAFETNKEVPLIYTTASNIPSVTSGLQIPPSYSQGAVSPTENDPLVGWIYRLSKAGLQAEMAQHNLPTQGKVDELRKCFVRFLRAPRLGTIPKATAADSDKIDNAELYNLPTNSGVYQEHRRYNPSRYGRDNASGLEEDLQGMGFEQDIYNLREILDLPPNSNAALVKRALTDLVRQNRTVAPDYSLRTRSETTYPKGRAASQAQYLIPARYEESNAELNGSPKFEAKGSNEVASVCNLVRKWNIHFDGKRDPVSFIERLEELKEAYKVNGEDLLRALPELFQGSALLWQRNNRDNWTTYQEFRREFEFQFWPPGYQRKLDEELRRRTQGDKEPFRDFVTALTTLMRRRGGFLPQDKLDILYSNMRPEYKLTVRREDCRTVPELITQAEHYESYIRDIANFQPPPNPAQALIAETAYQGGRRGWQRPEATAISPATDEGHARSRNENPSHLRNQENKGFSKREFWKNKGKQYDRESPPQKGINRNKAVGSNSDKPAIICWNCEEAGHLSRRCPKPKISRCYRCKKEGVRTIECGCTQENSSGAPQLWGLTSPQNN